MSRGDAGRRCRRRSVSARLPEHCAHCAPRAVRGGGQLVPLENSLLMTTFTVHESSENPLRRPAENHRRGGIFDRETPLDGGRSTPPPRRLREGTSCDRLRLALGPPPLLEHTRGEDRQEVE